MTERFCREYKITVFFFSFLAEHKLIAIMPQRKMYDSDNIFSRINIILAALKLKAFQVYKRLVKINIAAKIKSKLQE